MSSGEQPDQTHRKTRGDNDDERDEDRDQRAAEDDDAGDLVLLLRRSNTTQSQLDAQGTATDPASDDGGGHRGSGRRLG
ncbi:hypothetical protein ACODNH_21560 (plasmid) [Haloarcula sp. NS06]|uniref:hypothetical protein n=1 Tax=Haloarcula sp. NS06 TaxID=3409688 RepID=UPI003DA74C5C